MILADYTKLPHLLSGSISIDEPPWGLTGKLPSILERILQSLAGSEYERHGGIVVHKTSVIETGVTLKPPILILAHCFIATGSYLRGGVLLDEHVKIGPGVEIKSSTLGKRSAAAHFNFVGDSVVGEDVNIEAGAILANHFNEREDKEIVVRAGGRLIRTGALKFGSLLGDGVKIGANSVLSPGTILERNSIVPRLTCVEQVPPQL